MSLFEIPQKIITFLLWFKKCHRIYENFHDKITILRLIIFFIKPKVHANHFFSSKSDFKMTSNHQHPHGSTVNILKFNDSKEIQVENVEIEKIFLHPEVKNRKIVVCSIIGAFRRGKSFFLDYCLRFLYANVSC